MNPTPPLLDVDHTHVFVGDRACAQDWYARVLGLAPVAELASWAADSGPLTLGNPQGTIHLALLERPPQSCRSTVALSVTVNAFVE